ncbi:hypothetical protein AB0E69_09615 [Kribbella sp. NPDC026611]|uniref:hypothetical protein n=1 Tax=Kribbella sp. NPDC026611 TaxID=3154911 RepID=UPI0033F55576
MSFQQLPSSWTDQPLTDSAVAADVVDLMVSLGDRQRGTFTVLLCDPDDHYRAALTIDLPAGFGARLDAGEACSSALEPIIPAVHTAPGTGLVLALGRPGPARRPELDYEWAVASMTICRSTNTRLLGFYIAARDGIYQPSLDAPAIAA